MQWIWNQSIVLIGEEVVAFVLDYVGGDPHSFTERLLDDAQIGFLEGSLHLVQVLHLVHVFLYD
jgi:hypothetical protein